MLEDDGARADLQRMTACGQQGMPSAPQMLGTCLSLMMVAMIKDRSSVAEDEGLKSLCLQLLAIACNRTVMRQDPELDLATRALALCAQSLSNTTLLMPHLHAFFVHVSSAPFTRLSHQTQDGWSIKQGIC